MYLSNSGNHCLGEILAKICCLIFSSLDLLALLAKKEAAEAGFVQWQDFTLREKGRVATRYSLVVMHFIETEVHQPAANKNWIRQKVRQIFDLDFGYCWFSKYLSDKSKWFESSPSQTLSEAVNRFVFMLHAFLISVNEPRKIAKVVTFSGFLAFSNNETEKFVLIQSGWRALRFLI